MLAVCFVAFALVVTVQSKEFQIKNQGSSTIWVGILGNELLQNGGFRLDAGQQVRTKIITTDDQTMASNPTTACVTGTETAENKTNSALGKNIFHLH
jgi:hypothetical protein